MYKEVFASGTKILHPFYRCPHCGKYQEWTDTQIKTREEHFRYEEIMQYKFDACLYECIECKKEITESDRVKASEGVVWAAPEINQEDFTQKAETINKDGSIEGVSPTGKRQGVDTLAVRWPRLVDTGFKFWQCLAAFFKSKNDPIKLKTYQAETMSRYTGAKTGRVELSYIESKKDNYIKNIVPDDVLVITAGLDTHDDRWNYAYFGWCFGCQVKVLKHGIVPCKKDEYKDQVKMLAHFKNSLDQDKMTWPDGSIADFRLALVDRGGHRPENVDYLSSRIPNLKACIGSKNKPDYTKPYIYKSDKAEYYWQQTEIVSQLTGQLIESSDFYLPQDVLTEFINQLMRQWFLKKIGPDGSESIKWMHGGDDHYRDCFNLAYSAGKLLGLDKIMLDGSACESLYNNRIALNSGIAQPRTVQQTERKIERNTGNHYFNRALRR
jgi:DNA-directed RNA polymerase subunit RPC12/RpoP